MFVPSIQEVGMEFSAARLKQKISSFGVTPTKPSPGFHVGNAIDIVPMLRALALLFSFMQVFRVKDLLTLHLAQVQANQTLCTESWTGSPRS